MATLTSLHPVLFSADEERPVKLLNQGSTVYYKADSGVTSSSNDGNVTDGDDLTITLPTWFISAAQSNLTELPTDETTGIQFDGPVIVEPPTYSGARSYQGVAPDLNLAAGAGKDVATGTSYLAAVMGNVLSDSMTKTGDYLGGVIGAYSVTGTKGTHYPAGAVLGQITDGVTQADGAFVAFTDGDDSTTTAGAAFKVKNNNSTAASGFDFALDAQDAAHDGFQPVDSAFYNKGVIRLVEDVCLLVGTATPTNGTTGATVAGPGSLHLNTSDGKLRTNTNTKASPTWTVVGGQS